MDFRGLLRQQLAEHDQESAASAAARNGDGYDDDLEYKPPTEAQLKVAKARRERSDKIAKRMGEYLLTGWRMLDQVCPDCGTILMMPAGGSAYYCIACRELESDVSKDDPAQSAEAARTQAREAEVAAADAAAAAAAAGSSAAATSAKAAAPSNAAAAAAPAEALRGLRSAALDRLNHYRLRLLASVEPQETERLLGTLERLLDFLDRVGRPAGDAAEDAAL